MEKFFVYAIKSEKDNRIYVGMSKDIKRRLSEHNLGQVTSTKFWKPWKLIYQKLVGERVKARQLEKKLKSGYGKEFLKNL